MPPRDPNTPLQPNPFITGDSSDVSPAPPPSLVSNMPPADLLNPKPQQAAGSPVPPPPPVSSVPPPTVAPVATISSSKGGGLPKKLIGIVLLLFGLIFLGFVFIRFAIPRLKEGLVGSKEVQLTWWGLWEDKSIVTPLIEEYMQKNPKIKITYQTQSKEDYRERLSNSLAQGKGPDIFRFHNTWVPMFTQELSPIPSSVMSAQDFSQNYYPTAISDLTYGQGIVGIPLEYDGLGLYINEDIFATYSKTVPKTWTELRDTAIDLTIKDETGEIQQAGVAIGRTENVDHWQEILALMMIQNGAKPEKPVGDRAEGAIQFFTSLSKNYGVWDEKLPSSTIMFSSGRLAMYFGPSWRVFEILEQNPALKFRVVPVPQLPKVDPQEPDISLSSYWVEGVWERSPNKEEAWKFMKFLSTPESMQKLYQNASQVRKFGEPYPRVDMRDTLLTDPLISGFISLAQNSKSSYLVSRTYDGSTGINSAISKYYEDAINKINSGAGGTKDSLQVVATGVQQVLNQYGVALPTQ